MHHTKERLGRVLSLWDATAIGIGAVIGAGIFVVTGLAAQVAGPLAIIAVLLAAVPSFLTALSYAELGAAIPKDGGSYEFSYSMISPFWGFVNGWFYLLGYLVVAATVSVGFARYVAIFAPGVPVPTVAVAAIFAALAMNAWGVKQTARLNDGLVLFKVIALVVLVAMAFGQVHPENFAATFDSQSPANPINGLLGASALIFFAFLGFGRIATVAEEVENPKVNVPKAIFYSLAICTVLYLLVMFAAIGVVGSAALAASSAPISLVGRAVGGPALEWFLSLAALAATGSVLLTIITGTSRVALAMSRHGQLPRFFSKVSARGTPMSGMVAFSIIASLSVLTVNFEDLVGLAALGSLVFYSLTNVSAFLLETKHPEIKKPFKTPFHPLVPIAGLVTCVALAAFIAPPSWILALGLFAFGLLLYGVNSHLTKKK